MSAINEYPKIAHCPYLDILRIKLIHAKDFTPHKVPYYEQLIKDWIAHTKTTENKPA